MTNWNYQTQVEIIYYTGRRISSLILPAISITDAVMRARDHGLTDDRILAIINHNSTGGTCWKSSSANAARTTSTRKVLSSVRAAIAASALTATATSNRKSALTAARK
jgi:hypothetical protein